MTFHLLKMVTASVETRVTSATSRKVMNAITAVCFNRTCSHACEMSKLQNDVFLFQGCHSFSGCQCRGGGGAACFPQKGRGTTALAFLPLELHVIHLGANAVLAPHLPKSQLHPRCLLKSAVRCANTQQHVNAHANTLNKIWLRSSVWGSQNAGKKLPNNKQLSSLTKSMWVAFQ